MAGCFLAHLSLGYLTLEEQGFEHTTAYIDASKEYRREPLLC